MPSPRITKIGVKMGNPLDSSCPDVPKTLGGLFYEMGRRGVAMRCNGSIINFTYRRGTPEEVSEELKSLMVRNKPRILAVFNEPLE